MEALPFVHLTRKLEQSWTPDANWIQQNTTDTARPFARVRLSANVNHNSGVTVFVSWNVEESNGNNMHSNSVNPSRLTVNLPGIYVVSAIVEHSANGSAARQARIMKNGQQLAQSGGQPASQYENAIPVVTIAALAAGDYLETSTYQETGTVLSILSGAGGSHMTAAWVGPSS